LYRRRNTGSARMPAGDGAQLTTCTMVASTVENPWPAAHNLFLRGMFPEGNGMARSAHHDPVSDDTPAELLELGKLIASLPDAHSLALEPKFTQVVEAFRRRRRILALVQESLNQLRLDVKYLLFDLDATRRERDALRAELEEPRADDFNSW